MHFPPPSIADKREFLRALREWSAVADLSESSFIYEYPPVGRIGHPDEDRILATVFVRLCTAPEAETLTGKMTVLLALIETYKRHRDYAIDQVRSVGPARILEAARNPHFALKRYEQMIERLLDWLEALSDTVGLAEVG